jgi:hypothetical protein
MTLKVATFVVDSEICFASGKVTTSVTRNQTEFHKEQNLKHMHA